MWVAAACGPQVTTPDVADTGSGSGTSGATDEGGDTLVAPDLGAAEESTAAPIDCSEFDNEAGEGMPISLQVHNVGDEPILLDAPCFAYDWLELTTPSGMYWPGGFCGASCEDVLQYGCFDCDGCATSAYTVIAPGDSTEVMWPGAVFESATPPLECYQFDPCGETCSRLRLPAETLTVSVEAITHADCVATEPDPSVCDCEAPGRCENYGSTTVTPTLFGSATFEPGSAGPIVIEL